MHPRSRFVAVDILGNDVEVAAHEGWHSAFQPNLHLLIEAIHPRQLVKKFLAAHRISVRKVDVGNTNTIDCDFEKSRMTVCFVANERCRDYVNRVAR
jgi:hypothetical protein